MQVVRYGIYAILALGGIAYLTKPKAESLKEHCKNMVKLEKEGKKGGFLAGKINDMKAWAVGEMLEYSQKDLILFRIGVVRGPEREYLFLGVFSNWHSF